MLTEKEVRELDGRYEPFPPLSQWPGTADSQDCRHLAAELLEAKGSDPEVFQGALKFTLRAAAFDTGALENLYSTDRGLTLTVALQAASWQAQVDERDADARRFFEAQLQAYELTLDAVTRQTPISEAWIRRLHEEICASQESYEVRTPQGIQRIELIRGAYKTQPNHVLQKDGEVFAFAPVMETGREMARLVQELRSEAFEQAGPLVQAAYAHYALVRIHPFADGNGRVARALASLYLYRAFSVPLVIFADQKEPYLEALGAADDRKPEAFVDFIGERARDTLTISIEQLRPGAAPPAEETLASLGALYGDYVPESELQTTAEHLIERIAGEARRQLQEISLPSAVRATATTQLSRPSRVPGGFVHLPGKAVSFALRFTANAPEIELQASFFAAVTKTDVKSKVIVFGRFGNPPFEVAAKDIYPSINQVTEARIAIWVKSLIDRRLARLDEAIREKLAEES